MLITGQQAPLFGTGKTRGHAVPASGSRPCVSPEWPLGVVGRPGEAAWWRAREPITE